MAQADLFDTADPIEQIDWEPSYKTARQRLMEFLPTAGRAYASTRNFDYGPENRSNVSGLSPWVRHGMISEDEILRETLKKHSFKSAEKFVMEVFWRAYFKGWLEQHPDVWRLYKESLQQEQKVLETDNRLSADYNQAIKGETRIECFDFWAKELVETGYLHNHARMWFASIWIFTLKLPWVLGADFFYRHLLDGDPASNTLSWRWVAGLHTKGKNYTARASNIEKFTDERFNPAGQLNENPAPLAEDWQINQVPMPVSEPVDPDKKTALLVTEEDYSPDLLNLPCEPVAIAVLDQDLGNYSDHVQAFKRGALEAASERLKAKYDVNITTLIADEIAQWAQNNSVEQVITSYTPVGPVADLLATTKADLAETGTGFAQILRTHDQLAWPHATRGFFKLKKNIPDILARKGL